MPKHKHAKPTIANAAARIPNNGKNSIEGFGIAEAFIIKTINAIGLSMKQMIEPMMRKNLEIFNSSKSFKSKNK